MLNYIRENIERSQELAKSKINSLLEEHGYSLIMDEHNKEGIETRILQWTNPKANHAVQLIWDGKEDWFDLGEFEPIDNLNYSFAKQLMLIPISRTKWFNRTKYLDRIISSLAACRT